MEKNLRVLILALIIIALILLLYATVNYNYSVIFPDLSEPEAANYCGCDSSKKITGRVVNGSEVDANQLKWVAVLFVRFSMGFKIAVSNFCTAIILNKRFAISAGHCFNQYLEYKKKKGIDIDLFIGAGLDHRLTSISRSEENYRKMHDFFRSPAGDVALIELEEGFKFGEKTGIYPACLLEKIELNFGKKFIASGYGLIKPIKLDELRGQSSETEKKRTQVLMMTTFEKINLSFNGTITANNPFSSLCFADSGGPLHIHNLKDNKLYVIGVASSGHDGLKDGKVTLCLPGSINNFEPVFKHMNFIKQHLGDHSCLTNKFEKDKLRIDFVFFMTILCSSFLAILIIILLVLTCLYLKNADDNESFTAYYKFYIRSFFRSELE